jgi:putative sigma-54 modulation protein
MITDFVTKNYHLDEKLKELIGKKLERLDKYFDSDTNIRLLLKTTTTDVYSLELTIFLENNVVLRSEVTGRDMYANIDQAIPPLEKQIIKHRSKLASKSKKFKDKAVSDEAAAAIEKHRGVVKSKNYILTPMTVEDAIEEQELIGHSFFVFLNKATGNVSILYKRNDGDYGLIDTQVV